MDSIDPAEWAKAFCDTVRQNRNLIVDESYLKGWFENAFQAAEKHWNDPTWDQRVDSRTTDSDSSGLIVNKPLDLYAGTTEADISSYLGEDDEC